MEERLRKNIKNIRNAFLSAEADYVKEIMKKPGMVTFIHEISESNSPEEIFKIALGIINRIEQELVKPEEMEKEEQKLIVLFAALQDRILDKNVELLIDTDTPKKTR